VLSGQANGNGESGGEEEGGDLIYFFEKVVEKRETARVSSSREARGPGTISAASKCRKKTPVHPCPKEKSVQGEEKVLNPKEIRVKTIVRATRTSDNAVEKDYFWVEGCATRKRRAKRMKPARRMNAGRKEGRHNSWNRRREGPIGHGGGAI